MRSIMAAIAIALLLSACKTLGPEPVAVPPLTVGPGEGAVSLKLCREGDVVDRNYLVAVSKVEDGSGTPVISAAPGDSRARGISFQNATFLRDGRACHMWQFAATPGIYVISAIEERYRPGPAFSLLELTTQTVIAASKRTDTVRFADSSGRLVERAPTFDIRNGEVSRLGTLIFNGQLVTFQVPVRDKTGYWDGQTSDIVHEPRISALYEAPVPGETDNGAPIVGNVSGMTLQTLAPLVGREIVLEEPVKPEFPGNS
ncbi:MAG: hypothetical protein JJ959_10380 [Nisaea sp.]|uniref:hypothetical protein n=1 Tax=Nisaea sp. TaxID=2024842 RepID=UPI001B2DEE86|nr:hypothetical protein [Nisaea sp.]MBO6560936.1 hypothetical protein [Nisaea sp.]